MRKAAIIAVVSIVIVTGLIVVARMVDFEGIVGVIRRMHGG